MVVDGVDGVDRKDFQKIKEDLKRLKNYQFIRDDLVLSYLFNIFLLRKWVSKIFKATFFGKNLLTVQCVGHTPLNVGYTMHHVD